MAEPKTIHLSIGDVLGLLLEEFPDVTISKIRFLESQGLIEPERTPSGYRKFYEGDVDLLRLILREQRENFLPLRVIKDRIDSGEIEPAGSTPPRGTTTPHPADRHDEPTPAAVAKHPAAGRGSVPSSVPAGNGGTTGTGPAPSVPPRQAMSNGRGSHGQSGRSAAEQLAPTPASMPRPGSEPHSASSASSPRLLPGVVVNRDELCAMASITLARTGVARGVRRRRPPQGSRRSLRRRGSRDRCSRRRISARRSRRPSPSGVAYLGRAGGRAL